MSISCGCISRDSSIKVLFVNKCDSIVLVFESPLREDEEYRRLLQAFIDTALSSLEAEGILAMASIGVGRSYADATSLWKSFNEARRAAACWNIDNSRVHYFEKLGVYRFLSYENLRPELIIFYNETLKVLVDYDHDRDSELVSYPFRFTSSAAVISSVWQKKWASTTIL